MDFLLTMNYVNERSILLGKYVKIQVLQGVDPP
jgi:hypothetical protein